MSGRCTSAGRIGVCVVLASLVGIVTSCGQGEEQGFSPQNLLGVSSTADSGEGSVLVVGSLAETLGLDGEQRKQFDALNARFEQAAADLITEIERAGPMDASLRAELDALNAALQKDLTALLTPEQAQRYANGLVSGPIVRVSSGDATIRTVAPAREALGLTEEQSAAWTAREQQYREQSTQLLEEARKDGRYRDLHAELDALALSFEQELLKLLTPEQREQYDILPAPSRLRLPAAPVEEPAILLAG